MRVESVNQPVQGLIKPVPGHEIAVRGGRHDETRWDPYPGAEQLPQIGGLGTDLVGVLPTQGRQRYSAPGSVAGACQTDGHGHPRGEKLAVVDLHTTVHPAMLTDGP